MITDDILIAGREVSSHATDDPRARPHYDLYRRLRRAIVSVGRLRDPESIVLALLEGLVRDGVLAPAATVAYRRGDHRFDRIFLAGDTESLGLDASLAADHPLVASVLETGWVKRDLAVDGDRLVGLALGPGREFALFFALESGEAGDELETALLSVASIADLALEKRGLAESMEEAREIQTSLLPEVPPAFAGFELAMRSRPAVVVGGDIVDFHQHVADALGIVVGDASGHGLPAALHARDAVVGLRVGVEENLKVVKTIEKLDRVLRRGGSRNRFISLFFAEIDSDGNLVYVSAGHNPALLVRAHTGPVERLTSTGPVLGLPLNGRFRRGFQHLDPGDLVAIYTDGLVEAVDARGDEYGLERLIGTLSRHSERSLEDVASEVFATLDRYTGVEPQADDQSLVLIRRGE